MSVVSLPPDGASRKFKASQDNNVASKQQLVEKERLSIEESLRKKVELGNMMAALRESNAGKTLLAYCNDNWSFTKIMNEFEHNNKGHEKLLYQRQAIESLWFWIDTCVNRGNEARKQLADMEKQEA